MKLFLIRHGQTDWNLKGKIQGSYDSELNETGIIQAKEISEKILETNLLFTKIYTSQQKRALNTAVILSEATNLKYIPIEGLEEINFGEWEGLTWTEVKDNFPIEYEEWYKNRRYTNPPRGESYQEMLERVITAIHKIINSNSEDVIIVTHSAIIMCLQCYLTNTPFNEMMKFKTDNVSITEFDSDVLKSLL